MQITKSEVCIKLPFVRDYKMAHLQDAVVEVFDYYEPSEYCLKNRLLPLAVNSQYFRYSSKLATERRCAVSAMLQKEYAFPCVGLGLKSPWLYIQLAMCWLSQYNMVILPVSQREKQQEHTTRTFWTSWTSAPTVVKTVTAVDRVSLSQWHLGQWAAPPTAWVACFWQSLLYFL